jgi:hypothetical protein
MQGFEFNSSETLLTCVKAKFESICPHVLEAVFERSILHVAKSSNVKALLFLKTK